MPKDMPANLTALKNQLAQPGAWVWLLTVRLPKGGPTLRFASNTEDVVYGGLTYTAFNFHLDSFAWNSDGEIPELTMSVTNVGYALQDYVRDYDGLINGEISFVQVNTDFLVEDYSEDVTTLTIVGCENTWPDVRLTLSVPSALRYRVPEDRFNPHSCRHAFRTEAGAYTARCGYVGAAVTAMTFTSGSPVSVTMAGHGFVTGDTVRIYEVSGITGDLAGDYTVTVTDANRFALDGTDGDAFAGSVTGAKAGYASCSRIPAACSQRGRFPGAYGAPLSLRKEAVRYAT